MRASSLRRLAALRARENEMRERFGVAAPKTIEDCEACGSPLPIRGGACGACVGVDCPSHERPDRE